MNSFFVLVNDVLKTHWRGIDDLCACGDHDGNIPWSEHATEMLIDALVEHLGLAHELATDADDPETIVTRYVIEWRVD